MNWFALILGGLATYRVALMISKESGPWFIFRKLRKLPPKNSATKAGLECPFCVSVHVAAVVTTYLWWIGWVEPKATPLYWLAISSISVFCNQQWTKGSL